VSAGLGSAGLGRIGRELFLAAFGPSADLHEDWVLDRLTQILEEHPLRGGDPLWLAGASVDHCYFMRDGRVQLTRPGAPPWTFEGRWILGSFEPRGAPASHSAVALEDFDALRMPRRAWFRLLADSFALTRRSIVGAAATVAQLEERLPLARAKTPPRESPASCGSVDEPLGVLGRLAALAELEETRNVGVQALADLAAASDEIALKAGDTLFNVGDSHSHLVLVAAGTVETARREPDLVRRYGPGALVGGAAALCERINLWEARATTAARVVAVPAEAWLDMVEEHAELAESVVSALARLRAESLDRLAETAGPQGIVLT
jgi:CRP-like cAMP-binding protein